MAGLKATDMHARITWLGHVPDREASLRSEPVDAVEVTFAGFDGEAHGGLTRPSCGRVAHLYPVGTEIRNSRQITILSQEELAGIAETMGLERFDPAWAGASMVVEGIADLSHLPPGARLQAENATTLTVDLENGPCHHPAKVIDEDAPGRGSGFKQVARGRRGLLAWVERPGRLAVGDRLRLFLPDQPAWQGMV